MDPEQLDAEAPDEFLRRREFLQRTALAAGVSALLPLDTVVAEAARKQRRRHLPAPRNLPIDTFVVLMMENRSFDHYLGWLPGADGIQEGLTYTDAAGTPHATHRLTPDWQGCGFKDPDHSWVGGRTQLNGGACDGWLREGSDNDEFALGYYGEGDLGLHPGRGQAVHRLRPLPLLADGSTLPNREYMHAAQSYGLRRQRPAAAGAGDADRLSGHDDLRVARGRRDLQPVLLLRRAGVGAVGRARPRPLEPRRRLLRGRRDRDAAARVVRGPLLRRLGRRGAGRVGRRASARRRAHGPGVHGRRRARVHGVAAVEARGDLHRLRRVGRLLRPRQAQARPRHPQRRGHRQGLRADGLPHPGGGVVALPARAGTSTTRCTASSRS